MKNTIKSGDLVVVTDAFGKEYEAVAESGIEPYGPSLLAVWVRIDDKRIPWPVELVRCANAETPT